VQPEKSHLLPSLAVALCGATWGIYWIPVRQFENGGTGGGWISLVFCVVTMAAALPWLLQRSAWANVRRETVSGFFLGTGFALYTMSLVLTDVINAILLFYLSPIWSSLAMWTLRGQKLTIMRLLAIAGGLVGMALILGNKGGLPFPQNSGDWIALLSGMFWTVGGISSFTSPSNNKALPLFCFALGGALTSAILVLAIGSSNLTITSPVGIAEQLPWMIIAALIVFVPPNVLVLWASQRIDPGRVGVLLMTEALVGSFSSAMLSGEDFGMLKGLGAVLIIAAGFLEILGRPPQATR
jgi:drug/metabolite transporter (DMT)-like permease